MQQKKYRQLVVYLSKSLKTSEEKIQAVRKQLTACGFLISEYKKGDVYDPALRELADFVLVVPHTTPSSVTSNRWETIVGKGQYTEAKNSCREKKPAFIYMGYKHGEIMMSKCDEEIDGYWVNNSRDWKGNYGSINSFVMGKLPVPLYDFITGYMSMSHGIHHRNFNTEFPLTYSEVYTSNRRLLILN